MSIDFVDLTFAFLAGTVLGAGYLAVLWGSIRGLAESRRPIVRLLGGAVLRIGLLVGLIHLVTGGEPLRLLACLAGFFVARAAVTRWASSKAAPGPNR